MIKENLKNTSDDESLKNTNVTENEQNKKRVLEDSVKVKKNTRRRLSISTTDETPSENEEVKRSIEEMRENVSRFEEIGEEQEEEASGYERKKEKEEKLKLDKEKMEKEKKEKETEKDEMKIVKIKEIKEEGFMRRNINKRSSVAGTRAMYYQDDFEKKCVKIKGCIEGLNTNGIGYVCRKGLKPESPNQDDFIIIMMEHIALYAIFDGHGPYGHDVSNYVQQELPYMIIEREKFLENPKEVFTTAFLKIHDIIENGTKDYLKSIGHLPSNADDNVNVEGLKLYLTGNEQNTKELQDDDSDYAYHYSDDSGEDNKSGNTNDNEEKKKKKKKRKKPFFDSTMSGTTATVIVHMFKEKKLYVAYVGDSRAVLGKKKKDNSDRLEAVELTKDHKPNSEVEKTRIVNSGGEVMKLEGDIPYRVFIKNKFYPGLAMSRAIGDTIGHRIGITSEPDFTEMTINDDEDILVLICSDGVWEFISSEEAINMVYKFGYSKVQEAVEHLAKEAWDRWLNEEENIVDDITIQAFYLSDKMKPKK